MDMGGIGLFIMACSVALMCLTLAAVVVYAMVKKLWR